MNEVGFISSGMTSIVFAVFYGLILHCYHVPERQTLPPINYKINSCKNILRVIIAFLPIVVLTLLTKLDINANVYLLYAFVFTISYVLIESIINLTCNRFTKKYVS